MASHGYPVPEEWDPMGYEQSSEITEEELKDNTSLFKFLRHYNGLVDTRRRKYEFDPESIHESVNFERGNPRDTLGVGLLAPRDFESKEELIDFAAHNIEHILDVKFPLENRHWIFYKYFHLIREVDRGEHRVIQMDRKYVNKIEDYLNKVTINGVKWVDEPWMGALRRKLRGMDK